MWHVVLEGVQRLVAWIYSGSNLHSMMQLKTVPFLGTWL